MLAMTGPQPDHIKLMKAFSDRVVRRLMAAGAAGDRRTLFEDILGECQIAWVIASQSWKEEAGVPFMAYLSLGMRNHLNRWVKKELIQHNGSHVEIDASALDDGDELHEVIPDRNITSPEEAVELADRREKQLARLSPRARQFVELIESPPKALVDIVNGLAARRQYAVERGVNASAAPSRVMTGLVFRFMGASRLEQTKIGRELEETFNLKAAFAVMDGVNR